MDSVVSRPKGAGSVMASRLPSKDKLDYYPTPPWATRALIEHVLWPLNLSSIHDYCWEPACGSGDMARPLAEYFKVVDASDIEDWGFGRVQDFLWRDQSQRPPQEWIITNPPFSLAQQFVERAMEFTTNVAILARLSFIESAGRSERLFNNRLTILAPFAERVPMVKGRLDPKASSATAYAWFIWTQNVSVVEFEHTRLCIIPPCRKRLERVADYVGRGTS